MSILTQEQPMPYVKVKTKGQVTIPTEFRRDLNLKEGDLLEALVVDRYDEEWAKNVLKEAIEEGKRTPKTKEEDAEERCLLAQGARQAKKLGITEGEVDRIVYAVGTSRARRMIVRRPIVLATLRKCGAHFFLPLPPLRR
jgi:AbrB family looped-hinge helix DNA binding protein